MDKVFFYTTKNARWNERFFNLLWQKFKGMVIVFFEPIIRKRSVGMGEGGNCVCVVCELRLSCYSFSILLYVLIFYLTVFVYILCVTYPEITTNTIKAAAPISVDII